MLPSLASNSYQTQEILSISASSIAGDMGHTSAASLNSIKEKKTSKKGKLQTNINARCKPKIAQRHSYIPSSCEVMSSTPDTKGGEKVYIYTNLYIYLYINIYTLYISIYAKSLRKILINHILSHTKGITYYDQMGFFTVMHQSI